MKKLLALFLFSFSLVGFADSGTQFGDLLYLPNKGEKLFVNSSRLVDQDYKGTKYNASGAKTHSYEKEKEILAMDQKLSYSLSDQFLLGAGVEVAFKDTLFTRSYKDTNNYEVGYPAIKNNGWGDPYLYGVFRVLEKASSGSVLDVNFKLVPSFLNAKRGQNGVSAPTVGDHAGGGHKAEIGLSYGLGMNQLEALIYANTMYHFDSEQKYKGVDATAGNRAGDITYTEDSKLSYNLGVNSLYKLHYRFLVGLGLDAQFNPESSLSGAKANGIILGETTDDYWTYTGNLSARFIWLKDLYLEANFAYAQAQDYDFKTYTSGNLTTKESNTDNEIKTYGFKIFARF
jgi:hypothetical protein